LIDIANLSLSLFDNIKFKRNLPVERGYIKWKLIMSFDFLLQLNLKLK
jgi:hypothetical protein